MSVEEPFPKSRALIQAAMDEEIDAMIDDLKAELARYEALPPGPPTPRETALIASIRRIIDEWEQG